MREFSHRIRAGDVEHLDNAGSVGRIRNVQLGFIRREANPVRSRNVCDHLQYGGIAVGLKKAINRIGQGQRPCGAEAGGRVGLFYW